MILPVATFILISISFESRFPLKFILGEFWHFYNFEHWAEKENILWLGSWELTHLGFFVLLLLWVVTQNFSSQFHTLDYNTRFYGLTLQSLLARCIVDWGLHFHTLQSTNWDNSYAYFPDVLSKWDIFYLTSGKKRCSLILEGFCFLSELLA